MNTNKMERFICGECQTTFNTYEMELLRKPSIKQGWDTLYFECPKCKTRCDLFNVAKGSSPSSSEIYGMRIKVEGWRDTDGE